MRGGLRGWTEASGLKGLESLSDLEEIEAKRLKGWIRAVGEIRANEAATMGRGTLPERLAEVWLRRRGIRFESQVDLQYARPDFVLYAVCDLGCVVWRIQGDYWHSIPERVVTDAAQVGRLFGDAVDGQRIAAVIDLWEKDIYESDGVFERALSDGRKGNRNRFK